VSSSVLAFSRALVVGHDRVFVLAYEPQREEQRDHVTNVLRWTRPDGWAGLTLQGPIVALCAVYQPEPMVLFLGPEGQVHILRPGGQADEFVDATDQGPPGRGVLRDMRLIGGHVYVTGMGRQVYRREGPGHWARGDPGVLVPQAEARVAGFNSIDGFTEDQIYAVGWEGEMWFCDGSRWRSLPPLTNVKLQRVLCVPPDTVYACGQAGVLLRGFEDRWQVLEHDVTEEQFWGMEWFQEKLWLATCHAVYRVERDVPVEVDLGLAGAPTTTGWLHARDGLMWSVGTNHLLSTTDGIAWSLQAVP
jgi:hypothetical protein